MALGMLVGHPLEGLLLKALGEGNISVEVARSRRGCDVLGAAGADEVHESAPCRGIVSDVCVNASWRVMTSASACAVLASHRRPQPSQRKASESVYPSICALFVSSWSMR